MTKRGSVKKRQQFEDVLNQCTWDMDSDIIYLKYHIIPVNAVSWQNQTYASTGEVISWLWNLHPPILWKYHCIKIFADYDICLSVPTPVLKGVRLVL